MIRYIALSLSIVIVFLSSSCDELKKNTSTLKNSQGAYGEVVLVMDSLQWEGELGYALKTSFQKPFPGLPQAEAYFNLRHIKPSLFDGLLKYQATIIYVTTLDNNSKANRKIQSYFSEESLRKIKEDNSEFIFTRKDEFAKNQIVIHLYGRNEQELIDNVKKNEQSIIDLIDNQERKRIQIELYKGKEEKDLTSYQREKYNYGLRVPFGYDMAVDKDTFIWMSQLGNDLFRNLVIARKNYKSESDFEKDSIINWRNEIGRNHLFGSGEKDTVSYMLTDEKYLPVISRKVDFNGSFAIECRGLWKLKNNTRGGPFVSYTFVDESSNTMYYIEGFLYAPNKIKRHIMRELEAVLYTFQTYSDTGTDS